MEAKQDSFFLRAKNQSNKVVPVEDKPVKDNRQKSYDNNRGLDVEEKDVGKKPFDKKTYRLKKYSKKYKLDQWEEQRRKQMLRHLQKELKNEEVAGTYKPKSFDADATDGEDVVGRFVKHPDIVEKEDLIKKKRKPFLSTKEKLEIAKQDKVAKQQQIQKEIEERKRKLQEYKKKKQEKFKKLSKKTKKGQPVMTGRLELLLEKIQNNK